MLRPVEQQERIQTKEYINRVKQPEHGHGAGTRDFANEVQEAAHEGDKHRHPSPEFGQDRYESSASADETNENPQTDKVQQHSESADENGNLDIVI
jgi:hypothetical protein